MANEPLLSFHGKQTIKDHYLQRLQLHAAADEIIQGTGWEDGKGCAVGCTLHEYNHAAYETELGIPRILAKLEDRIFEGMSNENAKQFPVQFLTAIPVGKNLDPVWRKFFIWLLTDEKEGVIKYAKNDKTKAAIQAVSDLFTKSLTEVVPIEDWKKAYAAAYAAAYAYAYAAAYAAADAAADAYAAYAYAYAAYAYADAAYAYADAAYVYADAADAYAAKKTVRQIKYCAMRDQLLKLLSEA